MMMKMMRIVRLHRDLALRLTAIECTEDMCSVVVDDDDHSAYRIYRQRRQFGGGRFEQSTQSRNLFDPELRRMRSLEELSLSANDECEIATFGWLHLAEVYDEFQCI
jgi:hypothetical protein